MTLTPLMRANSWPKFLPKAVIPAHALIPPFDLDLGDQAPTMHGVFSVLLVALWIAGRRNFDPIPSVQTVKTHAPVIRTWPSIGHRSLAAFLGQIVN